jgi:hypothetical protein
VKTIVDKIDNILGEGIRPLQGKKMWPGEWKSVPKNPIKIDPNKISKDERGYAQLGYANGWKETPDIVKKCEAKNHKLESKKVGRGVTEYICHKCKYVYFVDSTD